MKQSLANKYINFRLLGFVLGLLANVNCTAQPGFIPNCYRIKLYDRGQLIHPELKNYTVLLLTKNHEKKCREFRKLKWLANERCYTTCLDSYKTWILPDEPLCVTKGKDTMKIMGLCGNRVFDKIPFISGVFFYPQEVFFLSNVKLHNGARVVNYNWHYFRNPAYRNYFSVLTEPCRPIPVDKRQFCKTMNQNGDYTIMSGKDTLMSHLDWPAQVCRQGNKIAVLQRNQAFFLSEDNGKNWKLYYIKQMFPPSAITDVPENYFRADTLFFYGKNTYVIGKFGSRGVEMRGICKLHLTIPANDSVTRLAKTLGERFIKRHIDAALLQSRELRRRELIDGNNRMYKSDKAKNLIRNAYVYNYSETNKLFLLLNKGKFVYKVWISDGSYNVREQYTGTYKYTDSTLVFKLDKPSEYNKLRLFGEMEWPADTFYYWHTGNGIQFTKFNNREIVGQFFMFNADNKEKGLNDE